MNFERPVYIAGGTTRVRTAHGNLYVTVNLLEDKPLEVFAILGKAGSCDFANIEAMTRLVSINLQGGVPIEEIIGQLRNVTCHPYMVGSREENTSPADAISRVLSTYLQEEKKDATM